MPRESPVRHRDNRPADYGISGAEAFCRGRDRSRSGPLPVGRRRGCRGRQPAKVRSSVRIRLVTCHCHKTSEWFVRGCVFLSIYSVHVYEYFVDGQILETLLTKCRKMTCLKHTKISISDLLKS